MARSTACDGLALVTADGLLELDEVQPAGGRRMTGHGATSGRRGPVGTRPAVADGRSAAGARMRAPCPSPSDRAAVPVEPGRTDPAAVRRPAGGCARSAARPVGRARPRSCSTGSPTRGQPAYRARQLADHVWSGRADRLRRASTRCRPGCGRRWTTAFRLRHARRDRRCATADGGPDREGAPPPRRRPDRRIGAHALPGARAATRAGHRLHLEPGRLRGRLPVLRHRASWASGATWTRRRSWTRRASGGIAWPREGRRVTNVVFMGMGEPLLNVDAVLAAAAALSDAAALRAGGAAHHHQHQRRACPGIERLTRCAAAVHAGGLAPRGATRAARPAGAAQPALAGRAASWTLRPPTPTPRAAG